jgi:spermidine/putrescine transport system permease protein
MSFRNGSSNQYVAYAAITTILLVLFIPIIVMVAFSLNDPGGRFNYQLRQFSLDGWLHPFAVNQLGVALGNSFIVALSAAVISAVVGTPLGYMLGRGKLPGKSVVSAMTILPLATPEVVLGSGLLLLFVATATIASLKSTTGGLLFPLGLPTVIIAHVTLGLSFVIISVRARVIGVDHSLEQAAQDLGARPARVFLTVWLPAIWPGIVSGALMTFALSLDDFVLTNFTAGNTIMFPTWLYGLMKRQMPPQIAVVGVAIFAISLVVAILAFNVSRSKER